MYSRIPGDAGALHVVGERDVIGPDVELPLPEAEDPAVDPPRVDPHPHVHVHARHLSHQPAQCTAYIKEAVKRTVSRDE
jgi:hypothetical protein